MADQPIIIKKKKVSGHGGHHGGSWKVAYADFVTAMMAFFMVMWIMGLSDSDKSQISGYFNDPMGFMKTPPRSKSVFAIKNAMPPKAQKKLTGNIGAGKDGDAEAMQAAKERSEGKELTHKIEEALAGTPGLGKLLKNIEFEITKEGLRIEFVESTGAVFFESGSYVVRPQAKLVIKRIAPLLRAAGRPMIVEGHTDAKPYSEGATFDNWNLSTMRALALRQALAVNGLGSDRFLAVRGLAATELKFPGRPFDFRNRRVSLLLPWSKVRPTVVDEIPKDSVKEGVTAAFRDRLRNEPPPIEIAPKESEEGKDENRPQFPVRKGSPASEPAEGHGATAEHSPSTAHAAPKAHSASPAHAEPQGHSAPQGRAASKPHVAPKAGTAPHTVAAHH